MVKHLIILFTLIFSSTQLAAQCGCADFESYQQSQDWIRELNKLNANQRKDSLMKRLYCENILGDNAKLKLVWVIEGVVVTNIPEDRFSLIEQVNPDDIMLLNSICEYGAYPEKCEMGIVLADPLVLNTCNRIELVNVKRKKGTTYIRVKAKEKIAASITIEYFDKPGVSIRSDSITLKKGLNKIEEKSEARLKVIAILNGEEKLVIVNW